jgi:hypothetical protein
MIHGMTPTTVHVGAFHVAYLDPSFGVGMLATPRPDENVWLNAESVHEADWNQAVRSLYRLGWEPLEDDETGELITEGTTEDGRLVISVYGLEPIVTMPSLAEVAEATNALRAYVLGTQRLTETGRA